MATSDESRPRLRIRRTLLSDGSIDVARSVLCPRKGHSATLEDCKHCGNCEGIFPDDEDRFIFCAVPAPPPVGHVAAMMKDAIDCVRADVRLEDARRLLLSSEQQALPVVDEPGRPIGVISRTDLLAAAADTERCVRDVMTTFAILVTEVAPPEQAAALMALESVHQLPVISAGPDGAVVGMVDALDLARWIARDSGYLGPATPV
jgi:CBS domain-containing protein